MGDILGYARVSTGDQDVAGQTMRLERLAPSKSSPMSFQVRAWNGPVWLS
jgi:DNA invertase Pin-like site-specific DNA recombinase